ncbi:MAG: glycosyl hydrolase [Crocinitomicaceae bacterium]|nr:glycosyl hydrolase [Crocinitomicaceae bacterium]|tara:strand:+ start:24889 stop:26184 length:1296 start_codon:yes stop_codon:yes gene_type:complete
MRFFLFGIFFSALVFSFGQSNFETVRLPLPKKANYKFSQVEPSIAIDPNNTNHIAAGSVLSDYYYSLNGGEKWKSKTLKSKFGVFGDPVLMFDNKSRLYYFHLANYSKSSMLDRIVCQSARKLSKRFNNGTSPSPNGLKVQDKHWTVLNRENNEIYMTWTQFDAYKSNDIEDSSIILFSKSCNQGKSWSQPIRISRFGGDCLDSDNTVEGAIPAVGPNGEIYVVWTGPKGLVFQKSIDGGNTWLNEELQIIKQYGGWDLTIPGIFRSNGFPIVKCDLSHGPNRGTIYINFCDQKNGVEDTDSWLIKSKDGGQTWSKRLKVNQDNSGKHQFFSWFTIDQSSGYLYFVYYDRRNYSNLETDVYLSVSRDGGNTFFDTRISKKSFLPDSNLFFGDYINIDAVSGVIRPIWTRVDEGHISLWIALIEEKDLLNIH